MTRYGLSVSEGAGATALWTFPSGLMMTTPHSIDRS